MLTFHIVLGKTVPDISRNAIANLGYADMRFLKPVYPGDTLSTTTEIIGLKENSNRKNGTVYVRSTGRNQRGEPVLSFSRWVMVNKRDESAPAPEPHVPELIAEVEPSRLGHALPSLKLGAYDYALAGSAKRWGDYQVGDKIDHVDGQTIEEAEHQLATRLFQNTARVHFNQHIEAQGPLQAPHRLWRPRDFHREGAELQRARQRLPSRRHQWRAPRGAVLCRRHHLCLERGHR